MYPSGELQIKRGLADKGGLDTIVHFFKEKPIRPDDRSISAYD